MKKWMVPLALAFVGPVFLAAERAAPPGPSAEILAALGAAAIECDVARASRYQEHIVARCGTTEHTAKSLKKAWRKAVRSGPLSKRMHGGVGPWKNTGATQKTMHTVVAGVPVAISVDFAAGIVAVFSPRAFPGCHQEQGFVWAADAGGTPQAVKREFADFPEEARRRPTSGVVMGSFIVDESGRVADVCIVAVEPTAMGFGRAAAEAQGRSLFRPATREGKPVAVAGMFLTTFELGTESAPVSALARRYFKESLTDSGP